MGTIDAIVSSQRGPPFRIVLQMPHSDLCYMLASAHHQEEIDQHWEWLMENIEPRVGTSTMRSRQGIGGRLEEEERLPAPH